MQWALHLLFRSGNSWPPEFLENRAHFDRITGTKELRAALWIEGVAIECDESGFVTGLLRGPHEGLVGYTPEDLLVFTRYEEGDGGDLDPIEDAEESSVSVRYGVNFMVGRTANFVGSFLTGAPAPFAWFEVTYEVSSDGRVRVQLDGSDVPSKWVYINGERTGVFDMLANTLDEVNGFLSAGDAVRAPGRAEYVWEGAGNRVEIGEGG